MSLNYIFMYKCIWQVLVPMISFNSHDTISRIIYVYLHAKKWLSLKRRFGGCRHGFGGCDGLGGLGGFGEFDGLGGFDGFSGFGRFHRFGRFSGFDG